MQLHYSFLTSLNFMRLATIELLRSAYGKDALGAFNVSNLEQIHGLFRGAAKASVPFIVQFTRVMRDYAHPVMLEQLLRGAEAIYPQAYLRRSSRPRGWGQLFRCHQFRRL